MNLFLSFLTAPAPSANYRAESERNRAVLQKILIGGDQFPVISPEAIRNALRDMLATYGLPCNRRREHNLEQLAVSFEDFPDAQKYADDFLFGYMVVNRDQIPKDRRDSFVYKRDSVIRTNLAIGLQPYRDETLLTQVPKSVGRGEEKKPKWSNADSAQLLDREHVYTAYQFPVALNLSEFQLETAGPRAEWLSRLLQAFSELTDVAGNQARSLFPMAPVSAIARVTSQLASGFPLYPFQAGGSAEQVVDLILAGHKPGEGFHLGGELLRTFTPDQKSRLQKKGVRLHATAELLLDHLSQSLCARSFLSADQ